MEPLQSMDRLGSRLKFGLCAAGIFVCYFYYGILQEKMCVALVVVVVMVVVVLLVLVLLVLVIAIPLPLLLPLLSTRGVYGEGEEEEKFTYIMALVAFQCAVNYLYALVMGRTVLQQGEDSTRQGEINK